MKTDFTFKESLIIKSVAEAIEPELYETDLKKAFELGQNYLNMNKICFDRETFFKVCENLVNNTNTYIKILNKLKNASEKK